MTRLPLAAAPVMAMALLASSASAQDAGASTDHLAALRACQGQQDPAARLACYDAAVPVVVAATDKGELRIVDQAEIKRTRRGLFGFALPDLGIFGGDDDAPDMEMLETTITGVRYTQSDTFLFKTKEGATWQVANAPARLAEAKAGDTVVLKKASLGSYFIRINGQIGVKGKRVS
ncbi:hypothetical protein GRI40_06680 [Altererythrobacter aerius]|uniref:Uncharacterized protein n=1 Tax=Tsuneonella aeria TaxID=1837929 RepID=A0A6I4TFF7_9SPHN|nr:hypothetical protein [Tsuneonella aeria]MXO74905.1 hypothetical protein [Tsuneonella aeria]